MPHRPIVLVIGLCVAIFTTATLAQKPRIVIPHHQDKPPGPPLSPEEAVKKMKVPEGFKVEIVAAEPQIVNPVAMTFDERGRVWVTESLEYPRRSAGPGRDRVKTLEDTDGDGRVDKVTVFADGLNIPSGVAVGHGGVWVANSPDILFMQDTDGDGKADKRTVVVTGFGRTDTHELPNSLTWGPDGWLYGLNGVFNHSHVRYSKSNPNFKKAGGEKHPGWRFTCAMFRIHPRTWEFQIFAEGTSNPWGIAFNEDGEAFISACVIDHLWHITETGYYHRQGGPYPPHTWKLGSIVKHKHQKAAYCGITWFDSDAYPEKYRGLLYMGNIHGGCINVDRLHRDGATYRATPEPDFLTANDAWFMPVVQKTGPDGCLYILDWYDRYHCYQDANRDPKGIDRLKGRLYRVRYKNTPRVHGIDFTKRTDEQLYTSLGSPTPYFRRTVRRVLAERNTKAIRERLERYVGKNLGTRGIGVQAMFTRIACGGSKETWREDQRFLEYLLVTGPNHQRAWGVRAAGNWSRVNDKVKARIAELARFNIPEIQLQVAIAARKIEGLDALPVLTDVLAHCGDDTLIPHIVWNNLQPMLDERADEFVSLARNRGVATAPGFQRMTPHLIDRLLARRDKDPKPIAALLALLLEGKANEDGARRCFDAIARRIQSGEIRGEGLDALREAVQPTLARVVSAEKPGPLFMDAALLAVTWKDKAAMEAVRKVFVAQKPRHEPTLRLKALDALIAADHTFLEHDIDEALGDAKAGEAFRGQLLASLGRLNKPFVASVVLANYESLEPANRPKAIELLTQRAVWAKRLLAEMKKYDIPAAALNENQVRRLLSLKDAELSKLVVKHWGTVRTERDPQRELFVDRMRYYLRRNPGDPHRGVAVYKKVCAQCHKMHGEGQEVGPDITANGRNSFEQLLSNVFDPSLVIGKDYQARQVVTADGRNLTGLLVEDSPQRVVLKTQGGKLETVARDDVEQFAVSKLSMMPEGLEKQLKPEELADLMALLTLDKPPSDPAAKRLSGVYDVIPQETTEPAKFNRLLAEVAPGFSVPASGERGVGLLPEYRGRKIVVRTHPPQRGRPCVIRAQVDVPKGNPRLLISASHDRQGDWQLIVRAGGKNLHDSIIGEKTTNNGWSDLSIDLSPYAGKQVLLEVENRPNDWSYEFAYWGRIEVVSE